MFDAIGFDADDTLWFSEDSFRRNESRFVELVSPYVPHGIDVKAALVATERANLGAYGYGVRSFGLSAVEAAIKLSANKIPLEVIHQILEGVRDHLTEPVRLFDGVVEVLDAVSTTHRIVLITKGDLIHQTRKIEASGLAHHFDHVEIVLEKDQQTYRRLLNTLDISPQRFCMVGNSMKSDMLPVLSLGGFGVHVPHEILWELEDVDHVPGVDDRFIELSSLSEFPTWLANHQ